MPSRLILFYASPYDEGMRFLLAWILLWQGLFGTIVLRDNLKMTKGGDYIVAAQGKNISLLRISHNDGKKLWLEEISLPASKCLSSWREWAGQGAPGNTSWVLYQIDLESGAMLNAYSYTRRVSFQITDAENFLGTLLSLPLTPIPDKERKLVGPPPGDGPDFRRIWQPKLIVEGHEIKNIPFSAWKTRWPKDGTELSDRSIVIYLPADPHYPAYFPYWLEISGFMGKAKVRIIDSGQNLFIANPSQSLHGP